MFTHYEGKVLSSATRPLLEPGSDVFIRYNEAAPILKKIVAAESAQKSTKQTEQRRVSVGFTARKQKRFIESCEFQKAIWVNANFKVRSVEREGEYRLLERGGPGSKKR